MRKLLIFTSFIFASMSVQAGGGWSQKGKIIEIYNHGYTVMIKMSGTNVDYTEICTSTLYYALDVTESTSFSIRFSQLLMAHASQADVQLWIDGGTCSGQSDNFQTITTIKSFK